MPALTPAQQATLSLLVKHHCSYDDIAGLLGSDPEQIRARAHEAVAVLMGRPPAADAERAVIDRTLGQGSSGDGDAGDIGVAQAEVSRRFAGDLAAALAAFGAPTVAETVRADQVPARAERAEVERTEVVPAEVVQAEVLPAEAAAAGVPTEVLAPEIVAPEVVPVVQRQGRPRLSPRMAGMLSLGLGSIAVGGVLFINGGH